MVTITDEQALKPVADEAARLLRAALDALEHAALNSNATSANGYPDQPRQVHAAGRGQHPCWRNGRAGLIVIAAIVAVGLGLMIRNG